MTNEYMLKEMIKGLMIVYEKKYEEVKKLSYIIIKSRIQNVDLVEYAIDEALNIPTDKGVYLCKLLIDYYYTFNQENALEYGKIFNEMYATETEEMKR